MSPFAAELSDLGLKNGIIWYAPATENHCAEELDQAFEVLRSMKECDLQRTLQPRPRGDFVRFARYYLR